MQIPKYQTAACIDNPHPTAKLDIRHDVPVPEPGAGEVLVKLEWTGFWSVFCGAWIYVGMVTMANIGFKSLRYS